MKKIFAFLILAIFCIASVPATSNASLIVPSKIQPGEPGPATVNAAIAELKSLSKKERKERVKEAKQEYKKYKKDKRAGKAAKVEQIVLIILAVLLPPLAVYLHQGEINSKFWICLLLTLLFIQPGIIYALIVVTGND